MSLSPTPLCCCKHSLSGSQLLSASWMHLIKASCSLVSLPDAGSLSHFARGLGLPRQILQQNGMMFCEVSENGERTSVQRGQDPHTDQPLQAATCATLSPHATRARDTFRASTVCMGITDTVTLTGCGGRRAALSYFFNVLFNLLPW